MATLKCYLNCNEVIYLNKDGQVWESVSWALKPRASGLLKGMPEGDWINGHG